MSGRECLFSFSINRSIIALRGEGGITKPRDVKAAIKLSHFTRRVKSACDLRISKLMYLLCFLEIFYFHHFFRSSLLQAPFRETHLKKKRSSRFVDVFRYVCAINISHKHIFISNSEKKKTQWQTGRVSNSKCGSPICCLV